MQASVVHKAIDYIDTPSSKSATRSVSSAIKKSELSKLASDYWNHLRTGEGDYYLYYLISDETLQKGYKRFGLTADDVAEIQKYLLDFKMFNRIEAFAFSVLPDWLQKVYENKQEIIEDDFILDDSFQKPFNLRFLIYAKGYLDYIVQEYYRIKTGHKQYIYVQKGHTVSKSFSNKKKAEFEKILKNTEPFFVPIESFKESETVDGYTHIIFPANDINNQSSLDALKKALDDQEGGNPDALVIIAFDDRALSIPNNFALQSSSTAKIIIKNLVITGRSLHSIGNNFFANCNNLESVILPDGITQVGYSFLYKCTGLTSLTLSERLIYIGNSFLSECISLIGIILPTGLMEVGDAFFDKCKGLTKLILPEGLIYIGNYFLFECEGLISITLPEGLTEVGDHFLYTCISLVSLSLPDELNKVGDNFLSKCTGLKHLILSNNLYKKLESENKLSSVLIKTCIRIDNDTIAKELNKIFTQTNDSDLLKDLTKLFIIPSNWPDLITNKSILQAIQGVLNYLNRDQINELYKSLLLFKPKPEENKMKEQLVQLLFEKN